MKTLKKNINLYNNMDTIGKEDSECGFHTNFISDEDEAQIPLIPKTEIGINQRIEEKIVTTQCCLIL